MCPQVPVLSSTALPSFRPAPPPPAAPSLFYNFERDFPDPDRLFAEYDRQIAPVKQAASKYVGDLTIDTPQLAAQYLQRPLYVDGNVTINVPGYTYTGAVIASGDITVVNSTSGSYAFTGIDGLALVSENGDIDLQANRSSAIKGLVYAPRGKVTFNQSSFLFHGGVAAAQITDNARATSPDYENSLAGGAKPARTRLVL